MAKRSSSGGKKDPEKKYQELEHRLLPLKKEAEERGEDFIPVSGKTYIPMIKALYQLGKNEWHSAHEVVEKVKELMSQQEAVDPRDRTSSTDGWQAYQVKPPVAKSNRAPNANDAHERLLVNYRVLQRIHRPDLGRVDKDPYGLKLQVCGMCIDLWFEPHPKAKDKTHGQWYVKLNTQFSSGREVNFIRVGKREHKRREELRQQGYGPFPSPEPSDAVSAPEVVDGSDGASEPAEPLRVPEADSKDDSNGESATYQDSGSQTG